MTVSSSLRLQAIFSRRPDNSPCSHIALYHQGAAIPLSVLVSDSLSIAHHLSETLHQTWALACDEPIAFIRGLLALIAAGKTICLPPNSQPGTLADIHSHASALLCDTSGHGFDGEIVHVQQFSDTHCEFAPGSSLVDNANLLFFTSGSTGKPKPITKCIAQLEAEINALESLWGKQLGQSTLLSCVSHQHIYGVIFRILWPLLAGRPVDTTLYEYPESLLSHCQPHNAVAIVASPAQLDRLPRDLDWSACQPSIKAVFSSGAPLSAAGAQQALHSFGISPLEVLGSTETGGVAWRQQKPDSSNLWKTLPGVNVSLSQGQLQVHSPWLDTPDAGFVMGDRADIIEGNQFLLKGRADHIVKIEGKRLSLTEMSQRLCDSPWVCQADVVLLQGARQHIGAVVILSQTGKAFLVEAGRLAISRTLKQGLSSHFEAVTLPRKWRYLSAMPVNRQGKKVHSDLVQLFERESIND